MAPIPSEVEEEGVEVSRTETGMAIKAEPTDTVPNETPKETTNNNNSMISSDGKEVINLTMVEEGQNCIERQVSDIYNTYYPLDNTTQPQNQFVRIRGFVQKLNDHFATTLYDIEQRHKAEMHKMNEAQNYMKEVFESKVRGLTAQEEQHIIQIKKLRDQISAQDEEHMAEIKKFRHQTTAQETAQDEQHIIQLKKLRDQMTTQEEEHMAAIKKLSQEHMAEIKKLSDQEQVREEEQMAEIKKHMTEIKKLRDEIKKLSDQEQVREEEHMAEIKKLSEEHMAEIKKLSDQEQVREEEHMAEIKKHMTEIKKLRDEHEARDETIEVLEHRVKTLSAQERDQIVDIKKMRDQMEVLQNRVETLSEQEVEYVVEKKKMSEEIKAQDEMNKALQHRIKSLSEKEVEHVVEKEKMSEEIVSRDEMNEVLKHRVKSLQDQELEHIVIIKKASDKLKRLEAAEATVRSSEEKLRVMEGREEKVLALAKKAALKIKDLESYKKKQTASAKTAVENIQMLKQMLLSKHNDMTCVKERAVEGFDLLAKELSKVNNQRAELQASLVEARKQYKAERELRKGDQKKIYSLRKMIEQYDEGVESTWSDLSQALSEEDIMNPLHVYREISFSTEEQFDQVKDKVLEEIPEEIKSKYRQVGFFNTNDYHFPVLALGPFDVPAGELRDKWLEKATSSLGIYYYGREDASMAYDMIPAECFIPYEDGAAEEFHILPNDIQSKALEGMELSPIEKVFEEGIKCINAEAQNLPEDRAHPLKEFAEFGSERDAVIEENTQSKVEPEVNPAELSSKFKEAFGASDSSELLLEALSKIKDKDLLVDGSPKRSRRKKVSLSVDVDCDNVSCVSKSSIDSASLTDMTITSLEEQVQSYMNELALASQKSNAAVLDTWQEEDTRERKDAASPVEDIPECRDDVAETRDESSSKPTPKPKPESKPEPKAKTQKPPASSKPTVEAQSSGLVQQRLMMFRGHPNPASTKTVVPDSSAKDVMKMWQMKAGVNGKNRKQQNTAPKCGKTFGVSDSKFSVPSPQHLPSNTAKLPIRSLSGASARSLHETGREEPVNATPDVKAKEVHANQQKQRPQQHWQQNLKPASTRCVTIPKNILKKIEGGEALTEHERKILKGIQKFNTAKPKPSTSKGGADSKIVIVQKSSTVSAVTVDEEKQGIEVTAE